MRFPEIDTLFIHVPKTGGTTITLSMAKQLYPEEAKLKSRSGSSFLFDLYKDNEKRVIGRNTRKAHVYAYQYKKILGEELYNKHYTFGFVRNPFEQIRSLYAQLTYMDITVNSRFIPYKNMTFEEFIMGTGEYSLEGNKDVVDQEKYFKDRRRKNIIVDDIFLYEYYNESIDVINRKLGLEINTDIVMRKTKNKDDCYSPQMASRVIDLYGRVYDFYKQVKEEFEENVLSKQ